ncbi:MAG: M20 family metallo-hydrolase [Prevotella sp.]|nr:M20 family metallo-hydrolase [Prevotella sp.]
MTQNDYTNDAVRLLEELIGIPSVSRDEGKAADLLAQRMEEYGLAYQRKGNNIWSIGVGYDDNRLTILLNAHIDTVRPTDTWKRNPFAATREGDRLYGLGSNDCGGGLVSLLQVLRAYNEQAARSSSTQKHNLVYLASAEEEVSGQNGFSLVLPLLPKIDVAIVGEPTGMQPAVAEKGLMVIELTSHGRSGHAARNEGENAIYALLDDLLWLRSYRFERVSPLLGPTLMQVTMINAGTQHNVVPDLCKAVVDVRTNELYTNEEVLRFLQENLHCDVKARSTRLSSSSIAMNHPLVESLVNMGKKPFGSPTLSDQALMPFPSLKMGPGDSSRSHTADEFICVSEIDDAIATYCQLLL